jgi:hypothetical protein
MSLLEPSRTEWRLARAAGALVDLRKGQPLGDDPAVDGHEWGAERTVRAQFLAELLTGARDPSDARGTRALRLRGARITGGLDLEGADLACSVLLQDCYIDEPVNLREAQAPVIRFPGCHLPGLEARQLEVRGNLILDGLSAVSVDVCGAHIGGVLSLDGAILNNPSGTTLLGGALTVDQGMSCDNGFTSRGRISLIGACIRHSLSFIGARLENPAGWALDAQGMNVGYALFLGSSYSNTAGFTAEGGLRLVGVHVDGFVSGWDAHIKASQGGGYAIAGLGLQVTGNLLLSRGFTADGEVHLTNAQVGNEIDFASAVLRNPGGQALTAERLIVGDSVLCTSGFTARGAINLAGSKISGTLDFTGADLSNPAGRSVLGLQGISARTLTLRAAAQATRVDLRHSTVVVLDDDPVAWPVQLLLRNFSYESIQHDPAISVPMRLSWLKRDLEGYIPQPYDQLASAYRRSGQVEAARKVAVAKQQRRRQVLNLAGKTWNWLLYLTIGYGYRTWQAGLWLLTLMLIGTAVFARAYPAEMAATRHPPMTFNAPVYTLDVLLPVINLGQQDSWQPEGITRYAYWALITSGWILTSALVAGLTGIFKRD